MMSPPETFSRRPSGLWSAYNSSLTGRPIGLWMFCLLLLTFAQTILIFFARPFCHEHRPSFFRLPERPVRPKVDLISSISQHSPVIADLSIKYSPTMFNGSLFQRTIYREDPSPEVDAAWEGLGVNYRPLLVPPDQALRSGIASDQVRVRPRYGSGYLANLEGLHHLHCLDLLRQALFFNQDYYRARQTGAWANSDPILKDHITHCVDILRQQLMCTVDVGVMGQVWWVPPTGPDPAGDDGNDDDDDNGDGNDDVHDDREGGDEDGKKDGKVGNEGSPQPIPFVDFNTRHVCRNFDEIREWARERQVPPDPPSDFLQPPGRTDRVFGGFLRT